MNRRFARNSANSIVRDEAGSQIVEFGLVLLPLMAFMFLIIDVAWLCFAQASLQHAVQAGVRAAVTGYVPADAIEKGQDAYIRSVVQENAMGFIAIGSELREINIRYYNPATSPLRVPGSNAGGNIIEVSVVDVPVSSLGPILRESSANLLLTATSSDVMESSPDGKIPPR